MLSTGYRGRNCSENVNECDSSPCLNGGTCQDAVNNYTCICAPLFTGTRCQLTFDPCSFVNNPCLNDGACVVSADGATCECQRGFTGNAASGEKVPDRPRSCIEVKFVVQYLCSVVWTVMRNYLKSLLKQQSDAKLFLKRSLGLSHVSTLARQFLLQTLLQITNL